MTSKRIKELIALKEKAKVRRDTKTYIVEGMKMCMEVPKQLLLETYVTKSFAGSHREWLKGLDHEVVEEKVFDRISDTKTPQGILCVVKQKEYELDDVLKAGDLYVILEDIQDPGNLGTIMRTAEGAGAAGVIMSRGCVDIYNPKTIRSTMGSAYRVPFLYVDDLKAAIEKIRSCKIDVYAAHLKGETYYDDINYHRAAFLIGNEGNGLREETAALADRYIKIPMSGQVESLNAAVSTAILMYEFRRQRRAVD